MIPRGRFGKKRLDPRYKKIWSFTNQMDLRK